MEPAMSSEAVEGCAAVSNMPAPTSRKTVLPPIAQAAAEPETHSSPPTPNPDARPASIDSAAETASIVSSNTSTKASRMTFKQAGTAVKRGLKASKAFSTLRDMGGAAIHPGDLKTLRKLGEGAFAVVEEAIYLPATAAAATAAAATDTPGAAAAAAGAPAAAATASGGGAGVAALKAAQQAPGSRGGSATGRRVAVKRLKPEIVRQEGDLASFLNEVALLRKLANKRIVEYVGVGSTDSSSEEAKRRTMFLVQEFMDGGTLKQLLTRQMIEVNRQLYTYQDAFRWAVHVAEGLEYLHKARPVVIHRDLKLENILLKGANPATAEAKIADFGLVALVRPRNRGLCEQLQAADEAHMRQLWMDRGALQRMLSFTHRTKSQHTVQEAWDHAFKVHLLTSSPSARHVGPQQLSGRTGSYMYMAPEVYRQEEYSEKVDVFSFGVILYEVLSRYQMVCAISLAGTQEEVESYALKVSEGYRPPLPERWPQDVRQLVAQCWHPDPAQRPSMAAVKVRLQQLQAQGVPADMQAACVQPSCCVVS